MSRNNTEGAVTVFLSCILLIVIVFTCTIIDTTRIRVAKLQALRALRSATTSVLANYDSGMASEYGVFALEKEYDDGIKNKVETYANAALGPKQNLPEMNQIYQIIYPDNVNNHFNLYDYDIQVTNIINTGALVENETDYIKLQILEYMKYRAPLLLMEPFLEKLELITKASKTTQYVKKKTELTNEVSEIDDKYRELEKLIDGLNISKKGNISYEDYFVKGILPKRGINRTDCLQEIPDKSIRSELQNKIFDIYEDANHLHEYIENFDDKKKIMVSTYKSLYSIRQEINTLIGQLSELEKQIKPLEREYDALSTAITLLESSSNNKEANNENNEQRTRSSTNNIVNEQINAIEEKQEQIEDSLDNLYEQQNELNSKLANLEEDEVTLNTQFINIAKDVRYYKNNIERLVTRISNLQIYLDKNKSALNVIEDIEKEGNKIKENIEGLEKELGDNKKDLIENTCTSIEVELKELKGKLAIPDDQKKTYSLVNNLYAIRDELQINIDLLTQNIPHIENLVHKNTNLVYHMLYGELDTYEDQEILKAFMKEKDDTGKVLFSYPGRYENNLSKYTEDNFTQSFIGVLSNIDVGIENTYTTKNMVFNYLDMKTLSKEEKDKNDPRNEVKKNTKNIEFFTEKKDVTEEVNGDSIPSLDHNNNDFITLITDEEVDFESEKRDNFTNKSLGAFSSMADMLKGATMNLRDELYVNEYIIGNFRSATDNLPHMTATTLSNYSKYDHYLNNEVEYILKGSFNENTNLKHVSNTILGIRFAMNYIHILTNSEKRNIVMGIATSIAGWWSFGLGTYIVAALIMAAWSYAESCVDVRYLLQGKKVAFLKTSGDWYTSLEGLVNNVIDETAKQVTDKTMKVIDSVATEVGEKVSGITDRLTGEARVFAQEKIEEIINDAGRTLNYSIDEIDNTIDKVINESFNNLREGLGTRPCSEDYIKIGDNKLLGEIIDMIYIEYRERVITASYSEIMDIKSQILGKFNSEIESAKELVMNKVIGKIEDTADKFELEVNKIIRNTSSKYKDITRKQINKVMDNVKKSINKEIDFAIDDAFEKKGKGMKIKSLIPSFSYNDYLRLMLLIGVNDDTKLYRILDLMQLNLQKVRDDDGLNLKNYQSGYIVRAEVSINYLFFGLPFMPDEAKDIANNRYKFTINTSMTY